MPQIVRTTNDVIQNALWLLGELGVPETPDAFMLNTGLDLINELLDKFAADSIYIPFLTTLNFTMVIGQATYSISDMIIGTNIIADRIVDLSFANYIVNGTGNFINAQPFSQVFTASVQPVSQLTMASTADFPTGTPVTFTSTGALPSPLIEGVTYFTIFLTPTVIYVAETLDDAESGFVLPILSTGSGTHTITTFHGSPVATGTSLTYPVRIINKATYWGVVRQNGLLARPGFVFLDKQASESFVTYYPAPDQPYPASIQVKSMINSLSDQETLGELPPNYYGFLKYALARKFLSYYPSGNWPQTAEDEYQDYYQTFKNSNETDFTIRPSVILTAPEPFYWPNILSY